MISYVDANLSVLSIHHIGNKIQNEYYSLSDEALKLDDEILSSLLKQYFLKPFEKVNEAYRFYHSSEDLQLNELYHFAHSIFEQSDTFHSNSQDMAKYLFDITSHPNIKSGEFYVAYFNDVQFDGETLDAIGIFKSETKDTYLKVYSQDKGFGVNYEQDAISINKLDKGCLIFNVEGDKGYKVLVIDQTNRSSEAVYWKDDFLKLKIRNDNYNQTQNVLGVYKSFVTEKLDSEFEISKADKIDLLNKSMKYFKENESFDLDEFSNEVIGNAEGIASFKNYKRDYELEFDSPIADSFEIADAAVKKQAKFFKSILKLDKNFHIYIHGNKDLIEKGFDEDRSMNYYKVFFKEEL